MQTIIKSLVLAAAMAFSQTASATSYIQGAWFNCGGEYVVAQGERYAYYVDGHLDDRGRFTLRRDDMLTLYSDFGGVAQYALQFRERTGILYVMETVQRVREFRRASGNMEVDMCRCEPFEEMALCLYKAGQR